MGEEELIGRIIPLLLTIGMLLFFGLAHAVLPQAAHLSQIVHAFFLTAVSICFKCK